MKQRRTLAFWAGVCLVNLGLAIAVLLLAPVNVGTTGDRVGYEYIAQNGLAPSCPHSIYCYRVLVPSLLARSPLPEVLTWRLFAVGANVLTGCLLAGLAVAASGRRAAWLPASILYQLSFGATFAVFDPFTPDAAVYLCAALLAVCWWLNRPLIALGVGLIGIFAKETVALLVCVDALAAWLTPKSKRVAWVVAAVVVCLAVVGFHAVMDTRSGWTEAGSASANLLGGSWLRLWLTDPTLTASARVLLLFVPFGFAWLWAVLGYSYTADRLKPLALASLTLLLLVYVQTPERALATLSFSVVPLAAIYLARLPLAFSAVAATTNGLLTARVGLSSELLPPVGYLLIVAGCVAAATIVRGGIGSRALSGALIGSSRTTSIR